MQAPPLTPASSSGSFLISPNVGLMVWTLILFFLSLVILWRWVFPRIAEALDRRQRAIEESIDAAEETRRQADALLEEYRERLHEAREQAQEIIERARRAAEAHERESEEEAAARREALMERTRREIEAETHRAIQEIRREVADLTVLATERVTRKVLSEEDQRRLVDEIADVYARALFEVATDQGRLDEIHEQLGQFADAMNENADLRRFFFSPYFSTQEKKEALHRTVTGAAEAFMNFLEALVERHRMPVIFRIRARFDQLWEEEHRLLPVQVTSAVELDEETVRGIGERIGERVGRQVELSSRVDPEILGGLVLRVGNFVLDASIRHRLEELRKQVARG